MMMLPPTVKIFLAAEPADTRKQHDSLSASAQQELAENVYSGHLFAFDNRRADRVKILTFDPGGLVLWYKRLEAGKLRISHVVARQRSVKLDAGQLAVFLEGVDYSQVKRQRQWRPPTEGIVQSTFP